MANKASKSLARTNTTTLNRTHLTTLTLHLLFTVYRLLLLHGSWRKYLLLSLPSLVIEFYLERLGRPRYHSNGELRQPGEDLAAKGVTEYAWDIVYVTWICLGVVGLLGEWAWWIGLVVPAYGGFLAYTTWCDVRSGVSMTPEVEGEMAGDGGKSKRQAKMEQRRGQKVRYR